jgi:hypothetical protein
MTDRALPNSTLEFMKKRTIPLTKQNYLDVEFMGQEPDEPLGAELEAEMLRALGLDDEEEES